MERLHADDRCAGGATSICLITGTRASADEIARCYRIERQQIRVTPYGSELVKSDVDRVGASAIGQHPYVLMVGTADRRKDFKTGLQAVALIRERGCDVDAVIVGTPPVDSSAQDGSGSVSACPTASWLRCMATRWQ